MTSLPLNAPLFGPFGSNLTKKDYIDPPGVPVIRGNNLGSPDERFIDENFVWVSEEKADKLRQNLAYPGDLNDGVMNYSHKAPNFTAKISKLTRFNKHAICN